VKFYQSDLCRFRAITLSPLHSVETGQFLPFIFAVLLLKYNFKCLFKRFLKYEKGYVGIAKIWRFFNLKITADAIVDF